MVVLGKQSLCRRACIVLLGVVLTISCSGDVAAPSTIEGIWRFETFDGTPVDPETRANEDLLFEFRDEVLMGHPSCNQFVSGYIFDGETITFAGGSITEVGCPGDPSGAEAFGAVLRASPEGVDVTFDEEMMSW